MSPGRRTLRVALTAAALLVSGPAQRVGEGQQAVFRSGLDLVNVGVTVTDRKGSFITDLRPEDFELLEDGRKQTITYFAGGDSATATPPLHLGLLFDTSGSMGDDINLSRSAAVRFLNTLNDAEDMTLVDFDTEVRVARYGQQDFPRMVERIRARRPDGYTALYDALGVFLDGASDNDGRTILVLYTDGGDTRSSIAFAEALTLVRASDATIYAVGFLDHQPSSTRFAQRSQLTELAETTGGQAFFPLTMKDVDSAYDKVVAQVRAQYSLGYVSTNPKKDGSWRKVTIRLTRPALKDARLQSRKGYFALYSKEGH